MLKHDQVILAAEYLALGLATTVTITASSIALALTANPLSWLVGVPIYAVSWYLVECRLSRWLRRGPCIQDRVGISTHGRGPDDWYCCACLAARNEPVRMPPRASRCRVCRHRRCT